MYLKKIYDHESGEPVVSGVKVLRAGKAQNFSPSFIEGGAAEGWLSMAQGRITIHGADGDIVYVIARAPGMYCAHCEQKLDGAGEAKTHIDSRHGGDKSPDPLNPAGYRVDNFYACVNAAGSVDTLTQAEAQEMRKGVRDALLKRLGDKHLTAGRFAGLAALLVLGIIVNQLFGAIFAVPGVVLAADLVFNIAKGRVTELYNRVDTNDPANSALVIVVIDAAGDTDATLRDRDDLSALLGGTSNEVTNTNYARKVLTDADLVAFAPDDTNDRVDLDIPDQTWTAVAAGTAWTDLLICYDNDTAGGTDSNIIPLTLHDFPVTPDGSDISAQIATAGFFRAS